MPNLKVMNPPTPNIATITSTSATVFMDERFGGAMKELFPLLILEVGAVTFGLESVGLMKLGRTIAGVA
jgi:hypothetical protein